MSYEELLKKSPVNDNKTPVKVILKRILLVICSIIIIIAAIAYKINQ